MPVQLCCTIGLLLLALPVPARDHVSLRRRPAPAWPLPLPAGWPYRAPFLCEPSALLLAHSAHTMPPNLALLAAVVPTPAPADAGFWCGSSHNYKLAECAHLRYPLVGFATVLCFSPLANAPVYVPILKQCCLHCGHCVCADPLAMAMLHAFAADWRIPIYLQHYVVPQRSMHCKTPWAPRAAVGACQHVHAYEL